MSHLPTPPSTTPHSPPTSSSSSSSSTSSSASRRRQEREEEAAKHAQEAWSASSSFHSVFGKKGMNLSIGSVSALEGSWRDGAPQAQLSSASVGRGEEAPVMLGKEQENKGLGVDETGDDGDCLGRVDLEGSKGISKSMAKNETRELLAIQVLARMMDSSKGRDKVLKCIQYTLKTYLYLMSLFVRVRPLSPWFRANRKRMAIAVSGLSLTRKCLLLLTPLHPLSDLLSPAPISARTLLLHLVDLAGAVADDVFCLSKLGVLARGKGEVGGRWADRIWFLTTLIGLYKLHTQTIPSLPPLSKPVSVTACADRLLSPQDIANQREEERMWEKEWGDARWTGRKLVADLCFVSYDVLGLDFPLVGEPMQCVAGLVSGFISATKLYNQHWDASLGK